MRQLELAQRIAEKLQRFPQHGLRILLSELERAEDRGETVGIPATFGYSKGKPVALHVLVRSTHEEE
jgi:hypothetical protein